MSDKPLDPLISDTNRIAMLALLDIVKEVGIFCEDVQEKLESLIEVSKSEKVP